MKKLNNAILNNIVEKFVKRRKYKEIKISKRRRLLKLIPLPCFIISGILKPYIFNKVNRAMGPNVFYNWFLIALYYLCLFVLSTTGIPLASFPLDFIFSTLLGIFSLENYLNESMHNYFFGVAIFTMAVDIIIFNFVLKKYKLETLNLDKKIHEEDVFSEMLTNEDFKLIVDSFNDKIIKKIINEGGKNGLSYGDLSHLDELIKDEKETLNKIDQQNFYRIFRNLDRKALIKELKGKDQIEMIQYFENLGIAVKNKNKIIDEEENNFYSRMKPVKENYNDKILQEGLLKTEKEELLIKI